MLQDVVCVGLRNVCSIEFFLPSLPDSKSPNNSDVCLIEEHHVKIKLELK